MLKRLIRFYRTAAFLGLDVRMLVRPLSATTDQVKEFVQCFGYSKVTKFDPKDGRPRWWCISCGPVVQFYIEEDPRGWLPLTQLPDPILEDAVSALLAVQAVVGDVKGSNVECFGVTPGKAVELFGMTGESAYAEEVEGHKWLTNEDCAGWLTTFLTNSEESCQSL